MIFMHRIRKKNIVNVTYKKKRRIIIKLKYNNYYNQIMQT